MNCWIVKLAVCERTEIGISERAGCVSELLRLRPAALRGSVRMFSPEDYYLQKIETGVLFGYATLSVCIWAHPVGAPFLLRTRFFRLLRFRLHLLSHGWFRLHRFFRLFQSAPI